MAFRCFYTWPEREFLLNLTKPHIFPETSVFMLKQRDHWPRFSWKIWKNKKKKKALESVQASYFIPTPHLIYQVQHYFPLNLRMYSSYLFFMMWFVASNCVNLTFYFDDHVVTLHSIFVKRFFFFLK